MRVSIGAACACALLGWGAAHAAPVFMSAEWAKSACEAWNADADTKRWLEMGRGEYGPMKAMMFGRLSFDGPMGEAMGNMGPFEGFLRLVGSVPGDTTSCPK